MPDEKIKNLSRSDVMKTSKLIYAMLAVLIALSMVTACSPSTVEAPAAAVPDAAEEVVEESAASTSNDKIKLSLWSHAAGNQVESGILLGIIEDYNTSQNKYVVEIQDFPQISYNESVVAAALAGNLPDIIDVDGPVMPNWAWAGYMAPLKLSQGALDDWLPTAVGYWDGEVYSVGLWEAACAIYARKSVLEKYDIRIPTLDDPWDLEEFDAILETLQSSGEFEYALDLGMAWTGEWYPYGFSPFLQSFGGDIIDRSTMTTAEGALNGPEAIAFGEWWQSLFERALVPGTTQDSADRDTGFIEGRTALMWNGNWAGATALEPFGDDLLILPAPDFGNGSRIGAGSWQWGVSADSKNKEGATEFIEFMMQDKYLVAFSDGVNNIPSTPTAAAASKNYSAGAPFEIFFNYSARQATLRPPTPAYLTAALIFEKAMADIANGADVVDTLDAATDQINADIEANKGYGFDGSVVGPSIQEDAIASGK
jgi:multiple sugar transport system substrate-binding protein